MLPDFIVSSYFHARRSYKPFIASPSLLFIAGAVVVVVCHSRRLKIVLRNARLICVLLLLSSPKKN